MKTYTSAWLFLTTSMKRGLPVHDDMMKS